MFISELFIFSTMVLIVVGLWLKYYNRYWERKGMPYIKPFPLFGNFKEMFLWQKDSLSHFKSLYDSEKDAPCVGIHILNRPGLLLRDLDLIKNVLIKDFNHFSNRYSSSDPHTDGLGANNLFFAKNPKWKVVRTKLTPVFTTGKIKQLFPLVEEIGRELDKYLCSLTDHSDSPIVHEVKETNALYTTDSIASVAFGVNANSLKYPTGDFRTNGKRIFDFTYRRSLEFTSMFLAPQLVNLFHLKVFSAKTSDFIRSTISEVMRHRMTSNAPQRNDLIDVLIKFRKEAETDPKHFANDLDTVLAQAALFFSAGFETTSATMSFSLYELAKRQEIQQRLREEIRQTLQACGDGHLNYQQINEMKFLNNVITEVLRMYPPLPFLDRVCTAPKGYSLEPFCDYTIPPEMPVYIPAGAIQRDPKYFPNPDAFEPDRFSPENKLHNNIAAYMPFGVGPHNCIGERFGLIQAKVGLTNFLRNHYVTPCDKTPPEMILSKYALMLQSESGIHLNIVRDPLI